MRHAYRSAPTGRRAILEHVLVAVVLIVALGLLGVLAGFVWHLVAPRTLYVFHDHTGYFTGPVPRAPVAADGWFAVIGLIAGIGCGSAAQALFHRRLVGAALGLAIGGVLASLIAWRFGHWFGAAAYEQAAQVVRDGGRLHAPLDVRAKGVLTLWPLAATLTVFIGATAEEAQAMLARRRERRREVATGVPGHGIGSGDGDGHPAPYA